MNLFRSTSIRHCLLTVVALTLTWTVNAQAEHLHVCVFGFNSEDEIGVLRSHLPPDEFEFIDFSPNISAAQNAFSGQFASSPGSAEPVQNGPVPWLLKACRPDLACDITVYSGEFAGGFFGRYGGSLRLQDMEEASCQPRCAGLFHRPQEVFMLGCNTLATKNPDSRSPEEYLRVLLDHGFDRPSAERVVEGRYGPLGPSFRESVQRIFMGVPRIYGFASVAPSGERTASRLEKYLESKRDYARHLEKAFGNTGPNKELLAAFRWTSLVQMPGMTASDPEAGDRELICGVYDNNRTVAQRLQIIQRLLARNDFLSVVPTIKVFFSRHPPQQFEGEERRAFTQIQKNARAKEQVLRLVNDLDVSALKMELAHLAHQLDWITTDRLRYLAIDGARQLLLRPLTTEVVDIMCEITKGQPIGYAFGSEDLPDSLFQEAEGIRLISCLSPADDRVSARLVAGLDSPDVWARMWAAYALSKRLPLNEAVLHSLAGHVDDGSREVRAQLEWMFSTQRPLSPTIRAAVQARNPQLAAELGP